MHTYFQQDEFTDDDIEKVIIQSEKAREMYPFDIALYDNQDLSIASDSLLVDESQSIDKAIDLNPKLWLEPVPIGS